MWWAQLTVGSAAPGLVYLSAAIGKQAEQATGTKHISCVPLWSLVEFLGSYLDFPE